MAGRVCVAEVEELVEVGELDPDQIHLPGIFVQRLVVNASPEKRIEKRTLSEEK
jgi:3-oxoacid CoA-transferase subunit A